MSDMGRELRAERLFSEMDPRETLPHSTKELRAATPEGGVCHPDCRARPRGA